MKDLKVETDSQRSRDRKGKKSRKKRGRHHSSRRHRSRSKSSSSSRSRSSSSRSGSRDRYMMWRDPKRSAKRHVSARQLERAESLRFKRRSDLINYAAKHPGALGALFLHHVRTKLSLSTAGKMDDLYRADVTTWAATGTGLKETRDIKEVQLLSKILLEINKDRLPQAVDIIAQRIREVRMAKQAGNSWEKAELISLMPGSQAGSTVLPDGCLAL